NVIVTTGTPAQQQLALQSIEFLTKIFPGISLTAPVGRLSNNNPIQGIGHDWAGRFEQGGNGSWPPVGNGFFPGVVPVGAINVTNYILEGEEILVYMLGGMRYGVLDPTDPNSVSTRSAPRGFSTNKVTPCAMPPVNGPSQRLGPFFEFAEDRIVYSSYNPARGLPAYNAVAGGSLSATGVGYFPVYNDRFGTPFAFFAARGGTQNNYIGTDCLALVGPGFVPYFQSQSAAATVFHKSDTFQIVSAGRDRLFGSGGRFDPTNPGQFLTNSADYDNVSNVSNGTIVPK
ncbi:MAG TPA: hypothetical protein PKC45_05995, partial [Gemmatales bacterium]|nr:hypothetical protein [Gemmatales bacterium]